MPDVHHLISQQYHHQCFPPYSLFVLHILIIILLLWSTMNIQYYVISLILSTCRVWGSQTVVDPSQPPLHITVSSQTWSCRAQSVRPPLLLLPMTYNYIAMMLLLLLLLAQLKQTGADGFFSIVTSGTTIHLNNIMQSNNIMILYVFIIILLL